ncbi:hypothetical protein NPIL_91221 [Nephila pilipes]|uniref:Uncharacterized protein n=1 Tax=Nephila pilipes TaxID=299642 RepID=A0A8X6NXJ0_NEPPI|nr:hypothetical protein NPIL_91221 [Nephila pilipes]
MATEMECNTLRPTSPSLTQDKETCETQRLMNERLRILQMQHEDTYSHVCHIESRYMDRESDFCKGAYRLYLAAKEAAKKAEAVANNSQQREPRNSDILTQTEARRNRDNRYNSENRPRAIENNLLDNFYKAIQLIVNLREVFNKLSGLIKHLPSTKAAKGAENKKKYVLIEALIDEENESESL